MGIGLIPISEGMIASQPDLDEAMKDLAFCVLGTYGSTRAPSIICERVHHLMLLPLQYTVLGAGIDQMRRLFYISVESPEIPDVPEGYMPPRVRVVYETQTWSQEKNRYVPCPMRLCGITVDKAEDEDPWTMPTILDGRTPESLQDFVRMNASHGSLREIFANAAHHHSEFFEQLDANNNSCADYLKNLIDLYFEIRWRRNNGILW